MQNPGRISKMPTHDVFGSRPPTSRKQDSLCPRFFLVVDTVRFSPAYSYSTPSYRVPRSILGHDSTACCTTYCKLACLVWDTEKGGPWLPGCQFKGRCSRGRICRAHGQGGPAGWSGARARALGFKVVCSQGGNHSCPVYWAAPVGTGSWAQAQDGRALCLPCLLCLS